MQTVEEKIDAAVHAAFMAMGLSVENNIALAERLNDAITDIVDGYITGDFEAA